MPKPIERPKQYSIRDIYAAYTKKLLQQHPEWWGKREPRLKLANCYIYCKEGNKVVVKMSWMIFKEVVERFYFSAKEAVIQGETLKLGSNLGRIRAVRIERDFSKPQVDWRQTFIQKIPGKDGQYQRIYHTTEDYCKIEWAKGRMIPNETCYHFSPAAANPLTKKGFKGEFKQALADNPLLKYRYKFKPVINKYRLCNTPIQASKPLSETSSEIPESRMPAT